MQNFLQVLDKSSSRNYWSRFYSRSVKLRSVPAVLRVVETNGVQTMSSLDMVAYINSTRKPGEAVLRHDSFLAKVPQVLKAHQNFLGGYLDSNGQQRPCYNFPRREATFMAMSYSYELQQTVYDAWQEAEAKLAVIAPTPVLGKAWHDSSLAPPRCLTATVSSCKLAERPQGVRYIGTMFYYLC